MVIKNLRLNERIRAPQVRLIDQNNQQVGIVDIDEALSRARQAEVDLVEVAPNSDPPVCRLMDFGKWKYDQKKKEHKAKLKQHAIIQKEVRLRPKTDEHDRLVKVKKARQFLEKGAKVQFTMMFRGREMVHLDLAQKKMNKIIEELQDVGRVELLPKRLGRRLTMVLTPSHHHQLTKPPP
ncbi:MAG: translation initiation factor IF-3 [Phycisphaerae bacterium SM23_30]|nr:MAG: translation initiation factor IF-3 [Phycisphaerae bacterium SM23_30]